MQEVRSKQRETQGEDGHPQEESDDADLAKTGAPGRSRSREPGNGAGSSPTLKRSEPAIYRAADCSR